MKTVLAAIAVSTCTVLCAGSAHAQAYPSRPVTLVVTTTAGSSPDVLGRLLAPMLAQRLGQPFIVDNRAGASGNIGAAQVAKAPPDGHTIMLTALLFAMTPAFNKDLPFDPAADFAPIGTLAKATLVLVVHPSVPATSLSEFVSLVKRRPGEINYGTPGIGTPHHLIMELLKLQEGANMVHVPYKGTAGMITGLLGGDTGAAFFALLAATPMAQAGKLKILAVMADKRTEMAPNIPTFREAGIDYMDIDSWMALFAPAKTPRDIIRRIHQEVMPMIDLPAVREFNLKQGILPMTGTPEELGALVKKELARWRRVVSQAGIKAE